jgi:fructose transport system substrate-binding protein
MTSLAFGASLLLMAGPAPSKAEDIIIGLITKTDTNPFFVKMKEGAEAKAKEMGAELRAFAGKVDGDNETQVAAVESLIAAGAKGILITPSDSKAIVPTIERAREAGLLVMPDTPLIPPTPPMPHSHRQFQGRRTDRPVGGLDARRQGGGSQDRFPRPQPQ